MKPDSSAFLRIGIGATILWFAFTLLKDPLQIVETIPWYVSMLSISPHIIIYLYSAFLVIFSILLLLGVYTRVSALLLGLNLLHVTFIVGYGATGVRDLALAFATLAIFLNGPDQYCLDGLLREKYFRLKVKGTGGFGT